MVREESQLGFIATQSGAPFSGEFTNYESFILFDVMNLSESVARIDIQTESVITYAKDRDQLLQTPEWLDTIGQPVATWQSTRFEQLGNTQFRALGDLTLKGVKYPTILDFELKIEGETARMSGEAKLDRTKWSIGTGSWETEEIVGHDVRVTVELVARKGVSP
ncbi:MAG: hypothetical protein Alpg2KO_30540 [Alphaproteobacteria bacterium]